MSSLSCLELTSSETCIPSLFISLPKYHPPNDGWLLYLICHLWSQDFKLFNNWPLKYMRSYCCGKKERYAEPKSTYPKVHEVPNKCLLTSKSSKQMCSVLTFKTLDLKPHRQNKPTDSRLAPFFNSHFWSWLLSSDPPKHEESRINMNTIQKYIILSVLLSSNKLPQTWWLMTIEIYSLTVPEAKSLKPVGWWGHASSRSLRWESISLPLPASGGWCQFHGLWPHNFNLCLHLHIAFACVCGGR